jgi:hypothetical protein
MRCVASPRPISIAGGNAKVKAWKRGRFTVVGFVSEGSGGLLKLRLARREERGLIYVGRVGTGWDRKTARAIRHALEPLARPTAPKATIATPFPKVVFRPIAGDDELLHFNAAWLPHNDNRRFADF